MQAHELMLIGRKESYVIRVLLKKLTDAGMRAFFTEADVNRISESLERASSVVYYMETGETISPDILVFLKDRLHEEGLRLSLIGEGAELQKQKSAIPGDLLLETFQRPLDYEKFIATMSLHIEKVASGEYRKSVMVVDDDPTFLSLVRDWLKDTYKVYIANSGLQAIKLLVKNKVDLILLDHEMPVTSGPQVLKMLRNDEDTKDIPVIFLTGKSDRESVMEVMGLKPEGYLLKSIGREEVVKKLEEYFKSRMP